MKLEIKNAEYFQLEKPKGIVLFDDFKEAMQEMKGIFKGENPGEAKLWRVKRESKSWQMVQVSYEELFKSFVKGE